MFKPAGEQEREFIGPVSRSRARYARSGRVLGLILGAALVLAVILSAGPAAAENYLSLPLSALKLASSQAEAHAPSRDVDWNLKDNPFWRLDGGLDINADLAEAYLPDETPATARMRGEVAKGIRLSLAVAVLDSPRNTSSPSSASSGLKLSSSGPLTRPPANSAAAQPLDTGDPIALAIGLDWRVYGRTGVHLGYLYGADPTDGLTGHLEPLESRPQSVDLAYNYYMDGVYFSLGYIYNITPLVDSSRSNYDTEKALNDSTVYLRFQLRF